MPDKYAPEKTQHATLDVSQRLLNAGHDAESDEIELRPIFQAIKIRWKWPVIIGGVAASLALIVTLITRPEFEAGGSLYLANAEKNRSLSSEASGGISLLSGLLQQGSNMETQVAIINSRDMVERAILASGINTTVWKAGQRPAGLTFAGWKLGGESLSLYNPSTGTLRALYGDVTDPELKKQTLTIRFGQGGQYQILHHGQVLLTGRLGQPAVGPGLRLILRAVQPHFIPPAHAEYRIRIKNALTTYDNMTKSGVLLVSQEGGGGTKKAYLVDIHYKSTDPFAAERFVSELMHTYLSETQSWSTDQAGASYNYLSRQLEKIRTALTTADARLASYQSKSGVIAVSAGAKAMIGELANYETQRSQAKITLYGLTQIRKTLAAQPSGALNPYLLSSIQDPVLNKLSAKLVEAQDKINTLQKLYTSASPQMIQAQAELASIRSAISELVQNQEKMATQQLQSIDSIIAQHQSKMATFPHSELEVISLTRSSEVLGKLYMFLLQKQEEAAINKASTLTKNRILDTALVRDQPVAPNAKKDVVLFGFLGVFLGLSIAIGRYLLHPGFRSDEELRRRYPFLPVYGLLPLAHHFSRSKASLFQMPEPRSGYGEALRLLRGNFYLAAVEGGGQVMALTSAIPGDGKSTLAFQLAMALAQDGKKVLLMDADLRNPHAHLAFNVAQEPGLAGVLAGRSTWQEALHHLQDIGIDLITAGNIPPNPSEHLGSGKMSQLLADLRPYYDYVLMDTPPFPMVGDVLIIGPLVDRLLTIAKVEHTPRRAYQEHLQGILSLGQPLGLIINGIRVQGSYGYGYGYGVDADGQSLQPAAKGWRRLLKRLGKKR